MAAGTFQKTVNFYPPLGVVGELFDNSPVRAQSFILDSVNPVDNVFGRAFSIKSEGVAQAGNPGGTFVFAGYLANPKTSALFGDGVNPLNPSLTLPNNGHPVSLVTMGQLVVQFSVTVNVGDTVIYDQTTGELNVTAPGAALPVGFSYGYAQVVRYQIDAGDLAANNTLAVIEITRSPTLPA